MAYLYIYKYIIPVGNFAFLSEIPTFDKLFIKFYEAEKNLRLNYKAFADKIKKAFDAFVVEEEIKNRLTNEKNNEKKYVQIKRSILLELKKTKSPINRKRIVVDLCEGRKQEFIPLLKKYSMLEDTYDPVMIRNALKFYIDYLYELIDSITIEIVQRSSDSICNKEKCFKLVEMVHTFLCVYYRIDEKYDDSLVPIDDYLRIPEAICQKEGLKLAPGKALYVKKRERLAWYILSDELLEETTPEIEETEWFSGLWKSAYYSPDFVINPVEKMLSGDNTHFIRVYSLPGRPFSTYDTTDLIQESDRNEGFTDEPSSDYPLFITRLTDRERQFR